MPSIWDTDLGEVNPVNYPPNRLIILAIKKQEFNCFITITKTTLLTSTLVYFG
jgi:hypothetical protein